MMKADLGDYLISALQLYTHRAAPSGSKDLENYTRVATSHSLPMPFAPVSTKHH